MISIKTLYLLSKLSLDKIFQTKVIKIEKYKNFSNQLNNLLFIIFNTTYSNILISKKNFKNIVWTNYWYFYIKNKNVYKKIETIHYIFFLVPVRTDEKLPKQFSTLKNLHI